MLLSAAVLTMAQMDATRTASNIDGALSVWVDATTAIPSLEPAAPLASGSELTLENTRTQRAIFSVSGTALGEIGPRATVRLNGLEPGRYEVRFTYRGFVETRLLETR